jgi:hypothetical protein
MQSDFIVIAGNPVTKTKTFSIFYYFFTVFVPIIQLANVTCIKNSSKKIAESACKLFKKLQTSLQ